MSEERVRAPEGVRWLEGRKIVEGDLFEWRIQQRTKGPLPLLWGDPMAGVGIPVRCDPSTLTTDELEQLVREKRREIRSRFRPAPTPQMMAFLHGLSQIGPEVERALRWNWPAWIPARPFDQARDA